MHISLDLETWGKRAGCDIRSIGATVFNSTSVNLRGDSTFYIATDNPCGRMRNGIFEPGLASGDEDYLKYPLHRDPETVKWWNEQTAEAQAAFVTPVDLREACRKFTDWLCEIANGSPNALASIRIWANGPQFDIAILEAAYFAVGLPVPWHYRAPRDFRTIVEAAGFGRDDYIKYGEAHNALDDAISQAMTIRNAFIKLGINDG